MSMRDYTPIGDLVGPLIEAAVGLARLQQWVGTIPDPASRKWVVMLLYERGVVSAEEAELLIEHNALEAA